MSSNAGAAVAVLVLAALALGSTSHHAAHGATTASGNERLGMRMARTDGWDHAQRRCLNWLWTAESGWQATIANPSSGAYGIPQALPPSKMASAGSDWQSNPATQIRWGLGYIRGRYGSPCRAWSHETARGWY